MDKLKEKFITVLYCLIPLAFVFVGWEICSRLEIVEPALLSRPSEIMRVLNRLLTEQTDAQHSVLLTHIFSSLYRLFLSLILASLIGISLGILMGINRYVRKFFDPLLSALAPIPGIAWTPLFLIWLGFGDLTIITVGFLAAFFPIVYNTAAGVRSINQKLVWAAQSVGVNKLSLLIKVYIPSSLNYIFTGFKLGLARGWRTIIAVEMIAATLWGLGFMIFDAREYLQSSVIYGGIMILAFTYLFIEKVIISWMEKKTVTKWGMVREINEKQQ